MAKAAPRRKTPVKKAKGRYAGAVLKHKRLAAAREAGKGKGPRSQYWGATLQGRKR